LSGASVSKKKVYDLDNRSQVEKLSQDFQFNLGFLRNPKR
jgi:hypothetical protein